MAKFKLWCKQGLGIFLVLCLGMGLVFIFGTGTAMAAAKSPDTGRYVFQDYETMKPGLFVLDPVKRRYVDSGYATYMGGLKAAEPAVVKAAADVKAKYDMYRTVLLYFPGTSPLGYAIERGNARGVAWTAADAWALGAGKKSPWGCAALSEVYSLPGTLANLPEGPVFTMLSGPFYGFNRKLDYFSGAGMESSLMVNGVKLALKGVFWWMALDPTTPLTIVADPALHNGWAWQGMVGIPANMALNAGQGFLGKGVGYDNLFNYQMGNLPVSATGVDFGRQYNAMSKFGQIVF